MVRVCVQCVCWKVWVVVCRGCELVKVGCGKLWVCGSVFWLCAFEVVLGGCVRGSLLGI